MHTKFLWSLVSRKAGHDVKELLAHLAFLKHADENERYSDPTSFVSAKIKIAIPLTSVVSGYVRLSGKGNLYVTSSNTTTVNCAHF